MRRFEGRVLLATGGGSGLGEATARRFSREVALVAVADHGATS
jgi:meso-butanediol dehydrogenase / (S,S)-butanediol dehydrogenase / diacetyl reductase